MSIVHVNETQPSLQKFKVIEDIAITNIAVLRTTQKDTELEGLPVLARCSGVVRKKVFPPSVASIGE